MSNIKLIGLLNELINEAKSKKAEEAPSKGLSKKKKSEIVKAAKSGKDIGKKGKGFEKVAKAAGGGEKGKKIAAAAMWKNIKREDASEYSHEDDNEQQPVDHEVSMAMSSLKNIIRAASELMTKLGDEERNIPGWIQDHITNSENYIDQASKGFHELDNSK